MIVCALLTVLGLVVTAPAHASAHRPGLSWQLLQTGTSNHFRGLAAVSRSVAWLGGYNGAVLRTVDGGRTWADVSPPNASGLQFRDISASDATHAVAMAAGSGTDSRLYVTADGGRHWRLAYQNTNPAAFFDCMSFSDRLNGMVLSDPVDGRFRVLSTRDGGSSWRVLPNAGMPLAQPGEGGFAASGECLTTLGRNVWFGSGGGASSRIYHSGNRGRTWTAQATPIVSNASAGVIGLAFRTPWFGVAVGGDFSNPSGATNVAAYSWFGSSWVGAAHQPSGYRSGVAWVPHTFATVIAVGLTGTDVSYNAGRDWYTVDTGQFDTVSCARDGACWAAGDLGRVAVLHR